MDPGDSVQGGQLLVSWSRWRSNAGGAKGPQPAERKEVPDPEYRDEMVPLERDLSVFRQAGAAQASSGREVLFKEPKELARLDRSWVCVRW